MTREEADRLNGIAQGSLYSAGVMEKAIEHSARIFFRHMLPGHTLELGPAEGLMTDWIAPRVENLTVVDGAASFCQQIKTRHPRVEVVNSLFEEYEPTTRFQNIILGHVLEHVEQPSALLKRVAEWLHPNGRVLAAVPNCRSIHRQAAVIMGALPHEDALNERDIHHGHRRVYSPETFRREFIEAGLEIEVFGGYWLKPLSNSQIEASWTPAMVKSFLVLGERYPDISAEIYIVAKLGAIYEKG